jgi:hypothetical protein
LFRLTIPYIIVLVKHGHNICQGRPLLLLAPGARNLPTPLISAFQLNIRSKISVLGYEALNVLLPFTVESGFSAIAT